MSGITRISRPGIAGAALGVTNAINERCRGAAGERLCGSSVISPISRYKTQAGDSTAAATVFVSVKARRWDPTWQSGTNRNRTSEAARCFFRRKSCARSAPTHDTSDRPSPSQQGVADVRRDQNLRPALYAGRYSLEP